MFIRPPLLADSRSSLPSHAVPTGIPHAQHAMTAPDGRSGKEKNLICHGACDSPSAQTAYLSFLPKTAFPLVVPKITSSSCFNLSSPFSLRYHFYSPVVACIAPLSHPPWVPRGSSSSCGSQRSGSKPPGRMQRGYKFPSGSVAPFRRMTYPTKISQRCQTSLGPSQAQNPSRKLAKPGATARSAARSRSRTT